MILGSLDTFLEGARADLRLGRLSANAGMLQALLEYGTFEELRLYCPTVAERARLEALLDGWLPEPLRKRLTLGLHVELPQVLARGEIGHWHSAGWSRYLPGLAQLRARYAPRAVAMTGIVHSLNGPEMVERMRGFASSPFLPCDALLCSSTAGLEVVRRQLAFSGGFEGRLENVPLGIGEEFFHLPPKTEAREAIGVGNEFVFLWFGRISASTKADLAPLLYAFHQVRRQVPEVRLLLAGGCEEGSRAAFQAVIDELGLSDRVHLLKDPTDGDRAALYAAADAFVSPVDNHQETFGLSVVEAMAAGLPCVVSDWDGYKDLVEDGVSGFRIPTWWNRPSERVLALREVLEPDLAQLSLSQGVAVDMGILVTRMVELATSPRMAQELGAAARGRARANFHWEVVVRRMEAVWKDLAQVAAASSLPGTKVAAMDPWEVFAGYATDSVKSGQMLAVGALGRSIVSGSLPMPATWSDLAPLASGALMDALVLGLERSGPQTLESLRRGVASSLAHPADEVDEMVLWLLKYGILERVGS